MKPWAILDDKHSTSKITIIIIILAITPSLSARYKRDTKQQ